jgi:hypothetical protein
MSKNDFSTLLKIAERDETVMSELKIYLLNVCVEMCSVRDDIEYYLDDEVEDMWKCEIENKYDAYIDLEDEYDISDVLEECENVNDNCGEILDCIEKRSFAFEDWGEYGAEVLDYDYNEKDNTIVISAWFVTRLGWYLEKEAGIEPLIIGIDFLLSANHTDVA